MLLAELERHFDVCRDNARRRPERNRQRRAIALHGTTAKRGGPLSSGRGGRWPRFLLSVCPRFRPFRTLDGMTNSDRLHRPVDDLIDGKAKVPLPLSVTAP